MIIYEVDDSLDIRFSTEHKDNIRKINMNTFELDEEDIEKVSKYHRFEDIVVKFVRTSLFDSGIIKSIDRDELPEFENVTATNNITGKTVFVNRQFKETRIRVQQYFFWRTEDQLDYIRKVFFQTFFLRGKIASDDDDDLLIHPDRVEIYRLRFKDQTQNRTFNLQLPDLIKVDGRNDYCYEEVFLESIEVLENFYDNINYRGVLIEYTFVNPSGMKIELETAESVYEDAESDDSNFYENIRSSTLNQLDYTPNKFEASKFFINGLTNKISSIIKPHDSLLPRQPVYSFHLEEEQDYNFILVHINKSGGKYWSMDDIIRIKKLGRYGYNHLVIDTEYNDIFIVNEWHEDEALYIYNFIASKVFNLPLRVTCTYSAPFFDEEGIIEQYSNQGIYLDIDKWKFYGNDKSYQIMPGFKLMMVVWKNYFI